MALFSGFTKGGGPKQLSATHLTTEVPRRVGLLSGAASGQPDSTAEEDIQPSVTGDVQP
ncbi:MAG: hypothetical protein LBV60_16550 [Streptomyces sp.]|jgi:hypothetical protein|nr:hypothetical protein [Streptomyces sp.]